MRGSQFLFGVGKRAPAQLVVLMRLKVPGLSRPSRYRIEAQSPRIGRITSQLADMAHPQRLNAELFAKFAHQRVLDALVGFDVPAEHVPHPGQPFAIGRATAEQQLAAAYQHRANAVVHGYFCSGPPE